jgi:UDP-glucose 4-epimerase
LNWSAKRGIEQIVADAWQWHQKGSVRSAELACPTL